MSGETEMNLWHGAVIAIMAFILFSPPMFAITSQFMKSICLPDTCASGAPSIIGLLLHSIVLGLLLAVFPVC